MSSSLALNRDFARGPGFFLQGTALSQDTWVAACYCQCHNANSEKEWGRENMASEFLHGGRNEHNWYPHAQLRLSL